MRPRQATARRPSADHPAAYAELADRPEFKTGMEICRADLHEERGGDVPPPGPWSPCSAAAGLTQAYLDHLARHEPWLDPAAEAERAFVVEQFHLAHERSGPDGPCLYVPFDAAVASPVPGHPYVGAYVDLAPAHGEPDGPAGGILLVGEPGRGGPFLDRYRSLNRAEALWWSAGAGPAEALDGVPHAARRAVEGILAGANA